jgi:hypothetical protein
MESNTKNISPQRKQGYGNMDEKGKEEGD